MKHTCVRAILVLTAAVLTSLLAPAPAVAGDTCDADLEIIIPIDKLKPTTINIQHYGAWLIIHADIYYDDVASCAVYLNWDEDTPEEDAFDCWREADDHGNLIAKVNIRKLDELPGEIDKFNTFTLKGFDQDGRAFCGEEEVMIIDRGPDTSPPGRGGT